MRLNYEFADHGHVLWVVIPNNYGITNCITTATFGQGKNQKQAGKF